MAKTDEMIRTYDCITMCIEQAAFMDSLFRAILRMAPEVRSYQIERLALQGTYWAEAMMNDLDCEREKMEASR